MVDQLDNTIADAKIVMTFEADGFHIHAEGRRDLEDHHDVLGHSYEAISLALTIAHRYGLGFAMSPLAVQALATPQEERH